MALTRITIRQFEAFLAIVDQNGIAAAAQRLGLTSSAVSQLLAELERELGFRLFDRTT
ncbi:LysR family transcriptional regulator, partial [Paraburkholderia sp. SIMBA_055]